MRLEVEVEMVTGKLYTLAYGETGVQPRKKAGEAGMRS